MTAGMGERSLVIPASGQEAGVVALLHGRGSHPRDMAEMAQALALPQARFVIPSAPLPSLGTMGRSWYSRPYTDLTERNLAEFAAARAQVAELLAWIQAEGASAERTVVGGFSQGGVLALDAALHSPKRLAGALILSGGLHRPKESLAESTTAAPNTPMIWIHGSFDSALPVEAAREQAALLQAQGFALDYRELPMDHEVTQETLRMAREWLCKALNIVR